MAIKYFLADETIDRADIQELRDWLDTDPWLTQGKLVREFEERWAKWLGVKHALFVNSGSSANLLMYYSLLMSGNLRNKKVIVPAVSWATTVAPAIQLGFEPIMCESAWDDFGLDMDYLEDLLKKNDPAAVIIVPVLGVPNDMDRLMDLKRRYNFYLMEDTCAATGSQYNGQLLGSFGDMSSFSFYFGHHMSTIEGGMVATNDSALHNILLMVRSHGWAKDLDPETEKEQMEKRGVIEFNRPFTFYYPGFNVRSTDLNARIGLSQMNKIDRVVERRIENHSVYQRRFLKSASLHCQSISNSVICSISFAALAESQEHRDRIAAALKEASIETRPLGGGNMSRQPFWNDQYGMTDFPVADRIHATGFQLPNHPLLTTDDVNYICDTVLNVS
jgi:CDP-6-deoxy-D-xylo-4-hexulose-3-dehydrase